MIEDAIREVVLDAVRQALRDLDAPPAPSTAAVVADRLPVRALSVVEAAEQLGLSRSTIYNLIADGRLASLRVGGRRLVLTSAIEEFLTGETGRHGDSCRYCGAPSRATYRRGTAPSATTIPLCRQRQCHESLLNELAHAGEVGELGR